MKVYIGTDLEGIGGVVNFVQTGRDERGAEYERARRLLTAEVNAAVAAAGKAGAREVVVSDGHSSGYNFIVEDLHPGAEYVIGGPRPAAYTVLDESFDAVLLLGYHAMAGTAPAIMDHTQSSKTWHTLWLNGVKMGEIGQAAVKAGHFGVPVVFVSGDRAAGEEARALLGEVETVAVKEAIGRTCARIVPPARAREMVAAGITRALGRLGDFRPYRLAPPIEVRVATQNTDAAEAFARAGWRRLDGRTVVRQAASALEII